ncbi:hypothetical protein MACK_001844 [Theileria orientalis]|uniref:Uncharacterized protein n=1 Tax=Theileria orientalis TaxID=68886 RepID=A0A976MAS8_THEOR|nr:hypothetical protein MACK_001844 [Theileria orientalis]
MDGETHSSDAMCDTNEPSNPSKHSIDENKYNRIQHPDECLINAEISGLASPISAMCWHKGPYSDYFNDNSETTDSESIDVNPNNDIPTELFPKTDMIEEMEHLLSLERKEKDRVRLILEKNRPLKIDEHIKDKQLASRVSTLKLLSISSKLAKRNPSSAKPQLDIPKYLKEKKYQKLLLKDTDTHKDYRTKSETNRKQTIVETVRILDVDRLPLPILHHMLCYTLVKNVPAENVLKIISNIASLRDKNKHVCYHNLFKLVTLKSSPICAPEIVATLTRCYQSISIPFMVDYVRKYGTFSRKFLANLINRHSQPSPLDIFRYQSHSRNLPLILTRPWSLLSFVNLLKSSSAKRYMYLNLLNYGYVPNLQKFDKIHAYGTMDYELSGQILSFEKMLDENTLISDTKEDPNRPKLYDKILELQYAGDCNLEDMELKTDADTHEPSSTSLQFVKVLDQQGDCGRSETSEKAYGYKDLDDSIPMDGSHISWSLPWGLKRDVFHYRGKTYKLDRVKGWLNVKSSVRINYLKNVKMNKRKRERRLLRRRARKQAKLKILSSL